MRSACPPFLSFEKWCRERELDPSGSMSQLAMRLRHMFTDVQVGHIYSHLNGVID